MSEIEDKPEIDMYREVGDDDENEPFLHRSVWPFLGFAACSFFAYTIAKYGSGTVLGFCVGLSIVCVGLIFAIIGFCWMTEP